MKLPGKRKTLRYQVVLTEDILGVHQLLFSGPSQFLKSLNANFNTDFF